MKLDTLETLVGLMRNVDSESIIQLIAALEVELREREDEEQAKQDYDDLLARQYEADEVDNFLLRA